jgi:hypothetical protein
VSDFYVGYLPTPKGLVRFLRVAVPVTLWGLVVVGLALGRSQRDPGPAVWDDGHVVTVSGVLVARPCPAIVEEGGKGAVLLVEEGKHGASRAAALDGQRVAASGYLLRREGRRMLELAPGVDGLRALGPGSPPDSRRVGPATLRGQIVDSKCYLGAMKPGEGKTHKECATLCIMGGIPAVLVTADGWYLMADRDGGPLARETLAYIADRVEVEGEVWRTGPLLVVRAAQVRRR